MNIRIAENGPLTGGANSAAPSRRRRQSAAGVLALGRTRLLRALAEMRAIRAEWKERQQYHRDLKRLMETAPHLIEDIGLSQEEAERELAKPAWRP